MLNPKKEFLLSQALLSAEIASLQRASVYSSRASDLDRQNLCEILRVTLVEIAGQYTKPVSEDAHIQNIVRLANTISSKCTVSLVNGRFRFGIAQKALNLYLKYLWCLEQIPMPPHCPFDSRVMAKLPSIVQVSWTRLDDISAYLALVAAAKQVAAATGQSLAEWELSVYQVA
jgi:hypothetical protein